ncbi:MAG: glycyl-radical enzyme activating protein [Oscillospiraceae bacterium]|nr:glycyl-radical enzyme activating protein [Oscillospiraceae bacterium]
MNKELTGRIYDIQGFSVQDGPGVRTTVFLKGCPLHCPWCHSPESQAFRKQLSWMSMRCKGTEACNSRCIKACPKDAIELGETRKDSLTGNDLQMIHVKRDLCDDCGKCTEVCYPEALYLCGEDYTVERLVTRLIREKPFFKGGGGVTISGGECLCQPEFVLEVLRQLKAADINTAIDTTGFVKWEVIESILPYTDLFLYDLKHMDSEKHKAATGVPNELILENAKKIAENGGKMQIRVPVIPMFNHDEENIRKTAEFCAGMKEAVTLVQLLPYHNMGVMKYLRISDKPVMEATPPSDEYMNRLLAIVEEYGLPAQIH